jgi:hypothetical protein
MNKLSKGRKETFLPFNGTPEKLLERIQPIDGRRPHKVGPLIALGFQERLMAHEND